jgi:hypothetical protein
MVKRENKPLCSSRLFFLFLHTFEDLQKILKTCRFFQLKEYLVLTKKKNLNYNTKNIQGVSEIHVLILISGRTRQFMKLFSVIFLRKSVTN